MTDTPKRFERAFAITREGGEALALSLSSETPYRRYDWERAVEYDEVLSHRAGDVDLSMIAARGDSLPLLWNHDRDEFRGAVDGVTLAPDGKLRARELQWSARPDAQALRADVEAGLIREVSVGYYRPDTYTIERAAAPGAPEVRRYTGWMPFELSIVPIPADPTVGVGRAASPAAPPSASPAPETIPMSDTTPQSPAAPVADRAGEIQKIAALGRQHDLTDLAVGLISEGKTLDEARDAMMAALATRTAATPAPAAPAVHVKTDRRFSLVRAITGAAETQAGGRKSIDDGLEREVQQELARQGFVAQHGGFVMPLDATAYGRTRLAGNATSQGQSLIFTEAGEFIPMLRNRAQCVNLGARVLTGLTANISMPRQLTAASGQWLGENPGSNVTESSLTLGAIAMSPKTFLVTTSFTRLLNFQAPGANVQADQLVQKDLETVVALELDRVGLHGSGSGAEPRGILNTVGVSTTDVTAGAQGGAPTWVNVTQLPARVAAANAEAESMAYLTTPEIRARMQAAQKFPTSAADAIWTQPGVLNGYRAEVSNQVRKNLVKGTNSDCHAIIFGDWSQLVFGIWGGVEMVLDPYALKKQGVIEATIYLAADTAVRQPAGFAAQIDVRNV